MSTVSAVFTPAILYLLVIIVLSRLSCPDYSLSVQQKAKTGNIGGRWEGQVGWEKWDGVVGGRVGGGV